MNADEDKWFPVGRRGALNMLLEYDVYKVEIEITYIQDTSHSRQAGDAGDVIRSTLLCPFLPCCTCIYNTNIMSTVSKEERKEGANGSDDRAEALLDLSISLIDQALDILNRHLKEDRQMTHSSKLMPGGSVGKHFRHVRLYISLIHQLRLTIR